MKRYRYYLKACLIFMKCISFREGFDRRLLSHVRIRNFDKRLFKHKSVAIFKMHISIF